MLSPHHPPPPPPSPHKPPPPGCTPAKLSSAVHKFRHDGETTFRIFIALRHAAGKGAIL